MTEFNGLEKLRQRRLRYVESARENDFEEGLKNLLSELYPDNAHFIYELLQNAEDASATTVEFTLAQDHLTVTHDGLRPFSLADIESITSIGNSTKKDDPTQIGKFGVGFKAVFAYTTRPEIRSRDHSFAIVDLFVPELIAGRSDSGKTTFTFPFDRDDKPAATAREEVARGLRELDEKTLLFLNNIRAISYELPDGTGAILDREPVDDRVIKIEKVEGDQFVESHWLRLVGPSSVQQESPNPVSVAVAFRLELGAASKPKRGDRKTAGSDAQSPSTRSVVPLAEGDVSIYFPAVKESSGLRFHIHAPFASTVARDSVRDDPGNVRLIEDISSLIVEALPALRADGFIDDSFLAALPNEGDQIGYPYTLIRTAITGAFNDLEITPVRGSANVFAAAQTLVSSPGEFRNWLDPSDLPVLFHLADIGTEETPRWIRDREGRAGKFLSGLDTIEFGWDELRDSLENARDVGDPDDPYVPVWLEWLTAKSDTGISNLYQLVGRGRYQLFRLDLKSVPMVRLRRRGKVTHVKGPETHLPQSRSDVVQARVPVELAYFEDDEDQARANNLKSFYTAAGVQRWDESARINQRLAAYKKDAPIADGDNVARHLEDVRAFVAYAQSNRPTAKAKFADVPFLQAPQSDGSTRWVTPSQTFLDVPFRETGLSALHPRKKLYWKDGGGFAYDAAPYPLAGLYLDVEGIEEFLGLVGARVGIEIVKANVSNNPQFSWAWKGHSSETPHGERVDWAVEGLDEILGSGDPVLHRQLWHAVIDAPQSKLSAYYKANARTARHAMDSQLAQTLRSIPWVLDRNGVLRTPRDMTVEDLPDGWKVPKPNSLVHRLDFGLEATKRRQRREGIGVFLREEGLDEDGIDLLREFQAAGLSSDDIRAWLRRHAAPESFPEGPSGDPARRAEMAALDAARAPQHESVIRERSVVEGQSEATAESKAYLRGQYTSATGDMYCQGCRGVLPFRTKDGRWYFEAVRLVTIRKQVHTVNAVALCPLCAALYKFARRTTNEMIVQALADTMISEGQGSVDLPVVLNEKRVSIRFTGKHAIDLKTALGVAGEGRE